MSFQVGGALLDFLVLSILRRGDAYGYILTQKVRTILDVSETSLYPALRRLEKSGLLTTYGMPYQGRNRRYYDITTAGRALQAGYREEWARYRAQIETLLMNQGEGEPTDE